MDSHAAMHCAMTGVMPGLITEVGLGVAAIAETPMPKPNTNRETINIFLFIPNPLFVVSSPLRAIAADGGAQN